MTHRPEFEPRITRRWVTLQPSSRRLSLTHPTDLALSTIDIAAITLLDMNMIRRTLDIDAGTDARLTEMAAERGQDVAVVLAEAVALLDSVIDVAGPDVAEDRHRLDGFKSNALAVPLDDVTAWVASWDSTDELRRPSPRKIG